MWLFSSVSCNMWPDWTRWTTSLRQGDQLFPHFGYLDIGVQSTRFGSIFVRACRTYGQQLTPYTCSTRTPCWTVRWTLPTCGRGRRTRPTPTTSTTCTPTSPYSTSSGTQPHTHVFQGMGVRVYTIFLFFPIFSNFNTLFIMVSAIFIVETVKSLSILCMSCWYQIMYQYLGMLYAALTYKILAETFTCIIRHIETSI